MPLSSPNRVQSTFALRRAGTERQAVSARVPFKWKNSEVNGGAPGPAGRAPRDCLEGRLTAVHWPHYLGLLHVAMFSQCENQRTYGPPAHWRSWTVRRSSLKLCYVEIRFCLSGRFVADSISVAQLQSTPRRLRRCELAAWRVRTVPRDRLGFKRSSRATRYAHGEDLLLLLRID